MKNPITNAIGMIAMLIGFAGLCSKWWFPSSFSGTWNEIVYVLIAGAVFIAGLSDQFLAVIMQKFGNMLPAKFRAKKENC